METIGMIAVKESGTRGTTLFIENQSAVLPALPQPVGFHILAKLVKSEAKHGALFIPEARKSDEDHASMVAEVVAIGPDCYLDGDERSPSGPLCQVGDFILIKSMAGVRFMFGPVTDREEYRIINDDTPLAKVSDPSLIGRAY